MITRLRKGKEPHACLSYPGTLHTGLGPLRSVPLTGDCQDYFPEKLPWKDFWCLCQEEAALEWRSQRCELLCHCPKVTVSGNLAKTQLTLDSAARR